jgi:hypothetical protein
MVWDAKSQKLYGINGSGRSPMGLSYEQMKSELDKLGTKSNRGRLFELIRLMGSRRPKVNYFEIPI